LDLSNSSLRDARNGLDRLYRAVGDITATPDRVDVAFTTCLLDDLNTPAAMARLHELARLANRGEEGAAEALKSSAAVLGLLQQSASAWAKADKTGTADGMDDDAIDIQIATRKQARANRDFAKADEIRDQLTKAGVILEDSVDGTIWRRR
jgi:cysteinyl-tRNA synthetase